MDVFDFIFEVAPALRVIMRLGFMPKDEDFIELTKTQYEKYYEKEGHTFERIYALCPRDPQNYNALDTSVFNVCTELEVVALKRGWLVVEFLCGKSGKSFTSDKEKLAYAATQLPNVISDGTTFEHKHRT